MGLSADKITQRNSSIYGTESIPRESGVVGWKVNESSANLDYGKFSAGTTIILLGVEVSVDFRMISDAVTNWD